MNNSIEYIKVENLQIDDQNPRLPTYLKSKPEEQIIEYMLLDASTIELMQAIAENGFFIGEQLLVVKIDKNKYKVIEGNRRTTAVKLLLNPGLATVQKNKVNSVVSEAKYKPIEIPCLVFDTEKEIHNYLGYRHITGIQPWNLRQKARYLNSLKEDLYSDITFEEACKELARMIGSRKDYVKRILVGFQIYLTIEDNAFFRVRDLDEESFYFGYIADSLSRFNIVNFLGVDLNSNEPIGTLNIENLKKWTKWLFEKFGDGGKTRLKGKSDDLNKLNSIVANEIALKAFEDENLELNRAYELTEDLNFIFNNSIMKALNNLEQADQLTHKITDFYTSIEDDLIQIRKLTSKIKKVKDDFSKTEFNDDEF